MPDSPEQAPSTNKTFSDRNTQAAIRYGKVPLREKLFPEESKQRTYFDSGEFALKAIHKPSEISKQNMGTKHPQRSHISHPFCAVPGSSNICEDANDGAQAVKQKCESHLHEYEKSNYKKDCD